MSKRSELLKETLEEAAIAGAKEIKEFLTTYRGTDPFRFKRAQLGGSAVSGYTRWQASQNNMVTGLLTATRQVGVSEQQTLEILKAIGMLPSSTEVVPERLKLAK